MPALDDAYQDYFDQPVFADAPPVSYDNPHPISLSGSGLLPTPLYEPTKSDSTPDPVSRVILPSVN